MGLSCWWSIESAVTLDNIAKQENQGKGQTQKQELQLFASKSIKMWRKWTQRKGQKTNLVEKKLQESLYTTKQKTLLNQY